MSVRLAIALSLFVVLGSNVHRFSASNDRNVFRGTSVDAGRTGLQVEVSLVLEIAERCVHQQWVAERVAVDA